MQLIVMQLFKQDLKMNKIVSDVFSQKDEYNLFPAELITYAAKEVLKASSITINSLEEYCNTEQREYGDIIQILRNHGFNVTENPVFKLTRQQRRMLEKQIRKGYPYGNVRFTSRLMAYSQTKVT